MMSYTISDQMIILFILFYKVKFNFFIQQKRDIAAILLQIFLKQGIINLKWIALNKHFNYLKF